MPAVALTPYQLRSKVASVLQRDPEAQVIGLHATGDWRGDDELDLGERRFAVVRADTVLEVREALADAEAGNRPTVVLTRLEKAELGQDILARLDRCTLHHVDLWDGVKGLFKARQLDPMLRERCLAVALLEHWRPDVGYPPVPGGVLDAGTAWRAILHHAYGMEDREPDLPGLLRWAAEGHGAARYLESADDLRAATRARLAATLGPAAESILNVVESDAARDALAVAIACEVVFSDEGQEPGLQAAAARLERFHLHRPIAPAVGRTLARAAQEALDDLGRDEIEGGQVHLARADALLKEIQAAPWAHGGRLTPLAWEGRLRHLASAIGAALDSSGPDSVAACEQAAVRVAEHALVGQPTHRPRLERARMAVRLVRWLRTPETLDGSFGDLARRYRDEVALVDRARDALAGGDDLAELSEGYTRLERTAALRRSGFNRAFGTALADWTASGSDPGAVLRVEDLLAQAVAPVLAAKVPVLLVVLDGMSWPVAHELLADLRRLRWLEASVPGTAAPPPPVVAAIPSVTEFSRTSLLTGMPHRGKHDDERRLFPSCPALLARCERNFPPLLFHKGQLTEGSRGALAKPVEQALLNDKNRVIGVVINAVDDRLAGAQQVREAWTADAIRPLGALLQLARESGRAVVLASDHGHVWHRDQAASPAPGADARWRPADAAPNDGEVVLEGPRVFGPEGTHRLIAPWAEEVRYRAARNGYHGGATPQEMIAPLVLLADATLRQPVLEPVEPRRLAWWDGPDTPRPGPLAPPSAPRKSRKPAGYLFPLEPVELEVPAPSAEVPGPTTPPPAPGWLERLPRSPAYQAQRQMVRKFAPEDEVVARVLEALDRQGGSITPIALARLAGVPALRIDGLIAKLQRLLNLDGYDVIRIDRELDRVVLNLDLLKRQFDVD